MEEVNYIASRHGLRTGLFVVNTGKQILGKSISKCKLIAAGFWTTDNELAKRMRARLQSKRIEVQLTQGAQAEKLIVEDNALTV